MYNQISLCLPETKTEKTTFFLIKRDYFSNKSKNGLLFFVCFYINNLLIRSFVSFLNSVLLLLLLTFMKQSNKKLIRRSDRIE